MGFDGGCFKKNHAPLGETLYPLDFFGGKRGKGGGVISNVWGTFNWANVGSVHVFFMYGEYGFSFNGSWSILGNNAYGISRL